MWSRSTSAVYGWLSGIAVGALRQIHFVVSNDVPNDVYMRVVGELIIGACSGAILFAVLASLRNHLRQEGPSHGDSPWLQNCVNSREPSPLNTKAADHHPGTAAAGGGFICGRSAGHSRR